MFAISLALTLLIESAVAYLFGVRMPGMKVVWLVNTLTNPAAVLAAWLWRLYNPAAPSLVFQVPFLPISVLRIPLYQIPIEAIVFVTEAFIYGLYSREDAWGIRHPVLLSLTANLISWGTGLVL